MKINQVLFLLIVAAASIVGCAKKKKAVEPPLGHPSSLLTQEELNELEAEKLRAMANDTVLFYHRGACFGMCPIFNLTVYADGHAIYEGRNFVDRIGLYQTKMDPAALQIITDKANSIGYFGLLDIYDNEHVTDLPSTITSIKKDGVLKSVRNRYKGPAGLKGLYDVIDQQIEKQSWEKIGERR
jgi:hypothetical protein